MAKQPDFSRRAPTPPPALSPVPPAASGPPPSLPKSGHGDMPLARKSVYVADVNKQLGVLGWKEGDPIPPDFADDVARIQRELYEDNNPGVELPPDFKPSIAQTVAIEDLPPEYQAELRQSLTEYKADMEAEAKDAAEIAKGTPPDVVRAARVAAAAANAGDAMTKAKSSGKPPRIPTITPPEGKTVANVENLHPAIAQMQAKQAEPAVEPRPEPQDVAGGAPARHTCPRCSLALNVPYASENPDRGDRERFVVAVLSGKRFEKTYSILGDKATVAMRSLTTREADLAYEQLRYDIAAGKILDKAGYFMHLADYRMVMTVSRIHTLTDMPITTTVPAIFDIAYTPPPPGEPPETRLVPAVKWFYEEVLPQEYLRSVVCQLYRQFQTLMETLEGQADAPDFWQGIGSSPE